MSRTIIKRARIAEEEPFYGELCDYNLTIEQAEEVTVVWGEHHTPKTLKWVAENHPADLDRMMDVYDDQAGTIFFHALAMVNDKYSEQVAEAVDTRNRRIKNMISSKVDRLLILPEILHNWPWR